MPNTWYTDMFFYQKNITFTITSLILFYPKAIQIKYSLIYFSFPFYQNEKTKLHIWDSHSIFFQLCKSNFNPNKTSWIAHAPLFNLKLRLLFNDKIKHVTLSNENHTKSAFSIHDLSDLYFICIYLCIYLSSMWYLVSCSKKKIIKTGKRNLYNSQVIKLPTLIMN